MSAKNLKRGSAALISEVSQAELMCRMFEASAGLRRPAGYDGRSRAEWPSPRGPRLPAVHVRSCPGIHGRVLRQRGEAVMRAKEPACPTLERSDQQTEGDKSRADLNPIVTGEIDG